MGGIHGTVLGGRDQDISPGGQIQHHILDSRGIYAAQGNAAGKSLRCGQCALRGTGHRAVAAGGRNGEIPVSRKSQGTVIKRQASTVAGNLHRSDNDQRAVVVGQVVRFGRFAGFLVSVK